RPRWVDGTSAASGGHCAPEPAWPEDRPGHRRRIALGRCVQEVAVREMSATKGLEQRPFRPLSRTSRTDQRRRDCFIPTASDKLHLSDHGPADYHAPCPGLAAHVYFGRSAALDLGAHRPRRTRGPRAEPVRFVSQYL